MKSLLISIAGACRLLTIVLGIVVCGLPSHGQDNSEKTGFTRQDTLRGTITPERAWWNVLRYDISVTPDYNSKSIKASNDIRFSVLHPGNLMQVDLQEPMEINKITWAGNTLKYERDGNVFHVHFPQMLQPGKIESISISYGGTPREARNPPWDGGWIWKKDAEGRPWMSVACQGLGASVWYPCKDHQSDEPDEGASLSITVPDSLVAVGNGRLVKEKQDSRLHLKTYTWRVVNPINNYNIIPYIGKYVHWGETFMGEKGRLDCNYWVLDYDLDKAKVQFSQAPLMLRCFEYWFGPYPFYEDGYKLVESPHLGMEHQSAVAYGNRFRNGYLGRDLSNSGWGLKWDFIIVHESGHEWFANNVTSNDLADMWLHEGFTNYSETIYTTCQYGTEAGNDYCIGTRRNIRNDKPIIAHYGVNEEGSGDMYYKGGNLLHTIRQVINDDSLFRKILRGINSQFFHKTVNSVDVETYISKESGKDLSKVFDQYLRHTSIPVLEYSIRDKQLHYRWTNCVDGFNLPLKIKVNGKDQWINPQTAWHDLTLTDAAADIKVDRNFYVDTKKLD